MSSSSISAEWPTDSRSAMTVPPSELSRIVG
jgi:hypothetical protein